MNALIGEVERVARSINMNACAPEELRLLRTVLGKVSSNIEARKVRPLRIVREPQPTTTTEGITVSSISDLRDQLADHTRILNLVDHIAATTGLTPDVDLEDEPAYCLWWSRGFGFTQPARGPGDGTYEPGVRVFTEIGEEVTTTTYVDEFGDCDVELSTVIPALTEAQQVREQIEACLAGFSSSSGQLSSFEKVDVHRFDMMDK